MNIKVLGSGCKKCEEVYKICNELVNELNIDAEIEKLTEFKDILKYGVMKTPGLVINEKLQASGRVPSKKEIKEFINKNI